jgi:formate dehydrogenase iron-sulfur subunit
LGTVGLIAAGLMTGHTGDIALASTASNEDAWGILIDLTRCTGCNSCALACKEANNLAHPNLIPHELDSDSYCFVDQYATGYRIEGNHGFEENQFVKRQCMHCLEPACVSACTVGALHKTPEGPVVYDAYKCIGCRYCQYACPFGVPAYEWENPLGLIHKCQMCVTRLAEGQQPACVETCPNGSIRFGKRTALLGQARALIDSNPHRYIDHIYGEHEAGGTSVLYLSAIPFSEIGFPELDSHPIPRYAEKVMNMTPAVALGVATGATVLHSVLKGKGHNSESEEA